MRRFTHHKLARAMKRRAGKPKIHWRLRRLMDLFFQLLLPLIIFQLIRTLLLPTTFDVILLSIFVFLYLLYWLP
ncbi:hypothetical protein K8O68_13725 [Salipaludibacillus sp. CUR1]|uniref:Uncharacterized protein n=1 Tax=Salipaludibacillus aurantiacus TaxID=1601833 RepID=A0A1H9T4E1_9BACI|nr:MULTISPECIES: hypothetical protein [Salipaludibacillus]MCE7793480.1 hypothetical protein [Salipaludibacillus sp. CUR1]SER91957.1 hypothetical protein SAMN05518684_105110 [Salipaludibacillus aurantiacus]